METQHTVTADIRGRVEVEASWQNGMLTVQLIRVAELVADSSTSQPFEIRAKISIEHTGKAEGTTVKCSRFNRKVSFEVQALNCDKWLVVRIRTRDSITRRQTVIGSAWFSIRSIVIENKPIKGWYELCEEVLHRPILMETPKRDLAAQFENQFSHDPECFMSRVFLCLRSNCLTRCNSIRSNHQVKSLESPL